MRLLFKKPISTTVTSIAANIGKGNISREKKKKKAETQVYNINHGGGE